MTRINGCQPNVNSRREITIGKTTFRCLFPGIVRPHTPAEREGLKKSIKELGRVENRVIVVTVPGGMGVIDGWTRIEIADEIGLKNVPIMMTPSKDPEEWRRLAIDLNIERRQLTPEEKVRLRLERQNRAVEARAEGKSIRVIAEEEGVGRSTVMRDLEAAGEPGVPRGTPETVDADAPEANGAHLEPATVTGKDGKRYPAKGKSSKRQTEPAEEPVTDQVGISLDKKMQEVFKIRKLFAEARQLHRRLAEIVNLIYQAPGGERLRADCHYLNAGADSGRWRDYDQRNAALKIDSLEPYCSLCPTCHSKEPGKVFPKCPTCKGLQWITKGVLEDRSLPPEQRQALLDLAKKPEE